MSISRFLRRIAVVLENPQLLVAKITRLNMQFVQDMLVLRNEYGFVPNTIVDVGAAVGEFVSAARFVYPHSAIHAFEPIPASLEKLESLARKDRRLWIYPFVLSSNTGSTDFYLNEFSFSSSLLPMTSTHKTMYPKTQNDKVISVEVRRMDSLDIELREPVLLKVDVQGGELDVLKGVGARLQEIQVVRLEVSFEEFYEGQSSYDQIALFMKEAGFARFLQMGREHFSDPRPRLVSSDLVFFR